MRFEGSPYVKGSFNLIPNRLGLTFVHCRNSIFFLSMHRLAREHIWLSESQEETSIGYLGLRSSSLWQYSDKWSLNAKHKLWTLDRIVYMHSRINMKKLQSKNLYQRHSRRFGRGCPDSILANTHLAPHQLSLVDLQSGREALTRRDLSGYFW